jgi:hypothetical protein
MSDATPMPTPSSEQLAEWRALIERIRQGDLSDVVAWDEVAAARTVATYQVLVTQRVRQRLRDAPPVLVGSVAGIIAVLRVDPTEASMIFRLRRLGDTGWTVTFGAARGLLTYWVLQSERVVVLLGWMTDQTGRHARVWVVRDRPDGHRDGSASRHRRAAPPGPDPHRPDRPRTWVGVQVCAETPLCRPGSLEWEVPTAKVLLSHRVTDGHRESSPSLIPIRTCGVVRETQNPRATYAPGQRAHGEPDWT